MKTEFDYKPVTRDEMWKAKEIELLESIDKKLSAMLQPLPVLPKPPVPKMEAVKPKAPSRKKEVK